jgi:hypothetical protein
MEINKDEYIMSILQLGPVDGKIRDDFEFIGKRKELPEREAIIV